MNKFSGYKVNMQKSNIPLYIITNTWKAKFKKKIFKNINLKILRDKFNKKNV